MESFPRPRSTDAGLLAGYLAGLPRPDHTHTHPPEPIRSVREDEFEGHHVRITTTYEITVDGEPVGVHISLLNDGSAHCHGLPNYQFTSVVDLVRHLLKYFPEDFPPADGGSAPDPHGSGHTSHPTEGA